jgi:hypothetical protein
MRKVTIAAALLAALAASPACANPKVPPPCASNTPQWNDGCGGAVPGVANDPTLLARYGANRPPWNVAGVDYRVGHSGTLKDPSVAGNLPACASYGTSGGQNSVTVNIAPCTIDHFDLSLHNGICLNVGATTVGEILITNNNLKAGTGCQPSGGGIVNTGGPANLTFRYNTLDAAYNNNLSNIMNLQGTGNKTIEYNVFLHPDQHDIAFQSSGEGGNYIVRYNYGLGVGCCGNHGDWIVIASKGLSLDEEFNTVTIDPTFNDPTAAATALCYMSSYPDAIVRSAKCSNDTYIAKRDNFGVGHVSYVIRVEPAGTWSPGPFVVSNNYIDSTGSFGPILSTVGSSSPPITCTGNKDLVTGAAISGTMHWFNCN